MRVRALTPGSVIQVMETEKATCIGVIEMHPVWPQLSLVIWVLEDGTVSLDALHPKQDVGKEIDLLDRDALKSLMMGKHNGGRLHSGNDFGEESSGQESGKEGDEIVLS